MRLVTIYSSVADNNAPFKQTVGRGGLLRHISHHASADSGTGILISMLSLVSRTNAISNSGSGQSEILQGVLSVVIAAGNPPRGSEFVNFIDQRIDDEQPLYIVHDVTAGILGTLRSFVLLAIED